MIAFTILSTALIYLLSLSFFLIIIFIIQYLKVLIHPLFSWGKKMLRQNPTYILNFKITIKI